MSSSERVALRIQTEDPEAEIFLVDGKFRLKARGLGALREQVSPGLYKVKVHTGAHIRERYILVDPGKEALVGNASEVTLERDSSEVVMRFSRIPFTTAVPLEDVSWRRDYHTQAARQHSARVHSVIGRGSQLFVFSRTWTRDEPAPDELEARPVSYQLTLHATDGRQLVDLSRAGVEDSKVRDPWAACNIELDPGIYRLRLRIESGLTLERTMVTSRNWQTQVFLCQTRDNVAQSAAPSPGNGSVHLRRLSDKGFDPSRPGMRMTELARIGLRNARAVISPALLAQLRDTEARNPMLSIYGAHLLLLDSAPDMGLIRDLVHDLRAQLGAHPDVEALALRAGLEPLDATVFQFPPMLLRSWSLTLNAALRQPELVPFRSLASLVADRLWGNSPWVIWMAPTLRYPFRESRFARRESLPDLPELVRLLRTVDCAAFNRLGDVSPIERSLISYLFGEQCPEALGNGSDFLKGLDFKAQEPTAEHLARHFGVPCSTLQDALLQLAERFGFSWESPDHGAHPVAVDRADATVLAAMATVDASMQYGHLVAVEAEGLGETVDMTAYAAIAPMALTELFEEEDLEEEESA